MLKAALYARYSSDLQNPGSIDDQLRLCRELAERQGWEIVGLYHDEAVSGASLQGRDGLLVFQGERRARPSWGGRKVHCIIWPACMHSVRKTLKIRDINVQMGYT